MFDSKSHVGMYNADLLSQFTKDAAVIGLLLGCGLRRSETVNLRLDQLQLRDSHWVIVDMVGKGGRLRTVSVPAWCKGLIDVWIRDTGVKARCSDEFRRRGFGRMKGSPPT